MCGESTICETLSRCWRRAFSVCLLPLLISGCSGQDGRPQTAGEGGGPAQPSSEALRRVAGEATYHGIYTNPVTLQQGRYEGGPFVSTGASRPRVMLLPGSAMQLEAAPPGDNPDLPVSEASSTSEDVPQWLVLLAESSGGSGTFTYLAVLRHTGGETLNVATTLLGDRVEVSALRFRGAMISAEMLIAGPEDPVCCPTDRVMRHWRLEGEALVLQERFAGHLIYGHEQRQFLPCGADADADPEMDAGYWVTDTTGGNLRREYNRLAAAPYARIFVEMLGVRLPAPQAGFAEPYAEQIRVSQLRRAEAEGHGCWLDLAGARFRVMGVEPFWTLDVLPDALRFREMGGETLLYPLRGGSEPPANLVWQATTRDEQANDNGAVTLELEELRCVDSMSGSLFPYRARLNIGERGLTGCALDAPRWGRTATRL